MAICAWANTSDFRLGVTKVFLRKYSKRSVYRCFAVLKKLEASLENLIEGPPLAFRKAPKYLILLYLSYRRCWIAVNYIHPFFYISSFFYNLMSSLIWILSVNSYSPFSVTNMHSTKLDFREERSCWCCI